MPVILMSDHYDLWLDPRIQGTAAVLDLLRPLDASLMRSYPVSARVNTVGNDDPKCSAPIELITGTANLFE
jgi:putative SOS response-associated peptidase YedK